MTKELEALEDIVLYLNATEQKGLYCKNIEIIKTALKDYENTKAKLDDTQSLLWENKEKLEALEIIKEKGIILQFIKETYTVEQYNAGVFGTLVKPLTKEEYDLLKEVL